ncbi:MAG: GGDEF domain-containing protein [Actinomycetota bacterium]|nr:GGDEF domain-containing protein [Actinomycetota bacterium]MDQ2847114.1 GGDEF domain-containing protein [Actinomycetota bacterium]MDQ2955696.1 GGDEF domain-containing protein [Actinomycetota bacterium]
MVDRDVIAATEGQWYQARTRMKQLGTQSAVQAVSLITVISVPASYLASRFFTGLVAALVTAAGMLFAALPLTGLVWWRMDHQQRLSNRLMKTLRTQLSNAIDEVENESGRRHTQVRRQDFERSLHSALEMAEDEPEVIDVIERALATVLPDSAAELLLADNSHAHLTRMVTSGPADRAAGCSVDSPDHCPAARRSQVQRFADSTALDACPKLRGRAEERFSAICVPVSIMGRTVGVLHAVNEPDSAPTLEQGQDLGILADKVGARIGLLRVISESQLQASTDSLTGLLNRRSMQNKFRELRRTTQQLAVVVADLDHFKVLNDTYGHETGDRALRLFATTFAASLRREDLLSRHGGEEFVAVLPGCSGKDARTALDNVRARLAATAGEHGLPAFTCSFGVTEADDAEDLSEIIARADLALFEAKRSGRDRAVLYDGSNEAPPVALTVAGQPAKVEQVSA